MHDRVARCMLVAKVLAADGMMTDQERSFLETAMETLGLLPEERQRVRDFDGWEEAEERLARLGVEDKRALMDTLVQAVLADGKVSPHEMTTIERLSTALGLG